MRFTQDSSQNFNVIRGYGGGELRINTSSYRGAVIVSASQLIHEPAVQSLAELLKLDTAKVFALDPEMLLVGTGERQVFPDHAFSVPFLKAGIGVDIMDTGAACRTYNVLMSEQRRVVAMLLA
jgi:uncharacterized protein